MNTKRGELVDRVEAAFLADIEAYRRRNGDGPVSSNPSPYTRSPAEVIAGKGRDLARWKEWWAGDPDPGAPEPGPTPWRTSDHHEDQCDVVDATGLSVVLTQDHAWFDIRTAALIVDAVNAAAAMRAEPGAMGAILDAVEQQGAPPHLVGILRRLAASGDA